jgi:hypothetical protein
VLELPRRGSFVRQPAVLSTSYRRILEASQFKANPIVVMMLLLRKSGLQIQTGTNLEHQCCVSLRIAVYRCVSLWHIEPANPLCALAARALGCWQAQAAAGPPATTPSAIEPLKHEPVEDALCPSQHRFGGSLANHRYYREPAFSIIQLGITQKV